MDLLPDDMLANILGRLPPCGLAASRCVRKDWCTIVDARRLLRADILPLRLDGFFCLAELPDSQTYFFSRPSTGRRIGGNFNSLVVDDDRWIGDHCNGLLLLWRRVVNPATRQWLSLSPFPQSWGELEEFQFFLAYDPMVSPHCSVIRIPPVPDMGANIEFTEDSEWPPLTFTTHVFSSSQRRWEERSFVREGEAAGTVADMSYDFWTSLHRQAVYFRGALYVHCQNDSIMRIALSNNKYQMIAPPQVVDDDVLHLGKSEKGVYSALLWDENEKRWNERVVGWKEWPWCRVWLLNESQGRMEWVLKCNINLQAVVQNFPYDNDRYSRPWIVNDKQHLSEARVEDEFEWDFDNGMVLPEAIDNEVVTHNIDAVFLGFHPHKEIAFFLISHSRAVSYNLNTLRVQELGILNEQPIVKAFPYTPCWMGELAENN